jgi:excinuclease ABC subunit A
VRDLVIVGATEHNLKNVSLRIPHGKLVVFTGPSGSGKSTLAFDTIYAEGQRRYVESLSTHARQFLERLNKPAVTRIDGLSPSIALEQQPLGKSPRSTVGTVTEIADYLRLLFARAGVAHCPVCGDRIEAQTVQAMVDRIASLAPGSSVQLLAPICRARKGALRLELERLRRDGFVRARVDGTTVDLGDDIVPSRNKAHDLDVIVDRIVIKEGILSRISDSVELALRMGDGSLLVDPQGREPFLLSERFACAKCGVSLPPVESRLFSFNSPHGACASCDGLGCEHCKGTRLRKEALSVRIGKWNIAELCSVTLIRLLDHLRNYQATYLPGNLLPIAEPLLQAIRLRISFLTDVGLDYLSLDRTTDTLSSGEGQRIRLATQAGSGLVGVLYVLDEPSVGLHARDNERLIAAQKRLRDLGNSVLVVEHDREAILAADYVVDMGPGAGAAGGHITAQGSAEELMSSATSVTGPWLSGKKRITAPSRRKLPRSPAIVISAARAHNLQNVTVSFPLGLFVVVSGVSGSGKSTLVMDTLLPAATSYTMGSLCPAGAFDRITGLEHIDKVVAISQAPIGRTPRSNPATYTGAFGLLRDIFAATPEARVRGYKAGRFSFNAKGGRCEACQGDGVLRVDMNFLPDVFVTCDTCSGLRYGRDTLEVKYRGLTIADALALSVDDARELFAAFPKLTDKLEAMRRVGLGYISLGQRATTLSGGEAQRLKLASELSRKATGKTLYILDEPTTGLHFGDIQVLLDALFDLRDQGNSIIVVEHNLDVMACADWIIDLGPEGGDGGGRLVAAGPPDAIAAENGSHTGRFLRAQLPAL